ncbi:Putative arylamine N-acetyltransferase, papain-like cysteine peptidase superfamily [Septoria linicola]|uniref:Arylamine N-acetyltransferase, papain-like cysteine peptidase superfamily n=1 Tax=Septoria linicola TaxID=215465 RepID=A0A9Q9B325_9PEZI|nr:Putative arylamine N-acetyltransferase, papain-like cysteine peptidase superfamily [Septoria linicola]
MATFTESQLKAYFQRVYFSQDRHPPQSLQFVTSLLRHQLTYAPFETLGLHYSTGRQISLDPEALFHKIVTRRRGGYCLENNAFFGVVLRSLGFLAYGVACRITAATTGATDGSWRAMSHMANIVFIDGKKYLVDVGFGADGPSLPLPLDAEAILEGLPGQCLRLERKTLPQHTDPEQKVWVYCIRLGDSSPWKDIYHFHEQEFFALDFDVLNHYNMTIGRFTKLVVAQRFLCSTAGPETGLIGTILLSQDRIEQRNGTMPAEVLENFDAEAQRIAALEKHFQLALTAEEQDAIRGTASELRQK